MLFSNGLLVVRRPLNYASVYCVLHLRTFLSVYESVVSHFSRNEKIIIKIKKFAHSGFKFCLFVFIHFHAVFFARRGKEERSGTDAARS